MLLLYCPAGHESLQEKCYISVYVYTHRKERANVFVVTFLNCENTTAGNYTSAILTLYSITLINAEIPKIFFLPIYLQGHRYGSFFKAIKHDFHNCFQTKPIISSLYAEKTHKILR